MLRDWIDAQLGRGVAIFQLGARLWIRHFAWRRVACVRVSVIYVHFLAELAVNEFVRVMEIISDESLISVNGESRSAISCVRN